MKVSEMTKCRIARQVDELFAEMPVRRYGELCENPVTGVLYIAGEEPVEPQKEEARRILLQIEHFALNGPPDAQPLRPVLYGERKEHKKERFVLDYIVRLYARSLEDCDPDEHPSFADYASGVLWEAERVDGDIGVIPGGDQREELKKRFPPRELAGMGPGFCWLTPKEYAEYRERLRLRRARELALASHQKSVGPLENTMPQCVIDSMARANAHYGAIKTSAEGKRCCHSVKS
jgi:hypothetical protein